MKGSIDELLMDEKLRKLLDEYDKRLLRLAEHGNERAAFILLLPTRLKLKHLLEDLKECCHRRG